MLSVSVALNRIVRVRHVSEFSSKCHRQIKEQGMSIDNSGLEDGLCGRYYTYEDLSECEEVAWSHQGKGTSVDRRGAGSCKMRTTIVRPQRG